LFTLPQNGCFDGSVHLVLCVEKMNKELLFWWNRLLLCLLKALWVGDVFLAQLSHSLSDFICKMATINKEKQKRKKAKKST